MSINEKQLEQIEERFNKDNIVQVDPGNKKIMNSPMEIYETPKPTGCFWVFDKDEKITRISKIGPGEREALNKAVIYTEAYARGADYIEV